MSLHYRGASSKVLMRKVLTRKVLTRKVLKRKVLTRKVQNIKNRAYGIVNIALCRVVGLELI